MSTNAVTTTAVNETGTNSWWTYEDGHVPGIGPYAVNVGSSKNLVLQSTDFQVEHRGENLGFLRTYNSFSGHNISGSDGSQPSSYGNGWTNNLDTHIAVNSGSNSTFGITVYDERGARYDYLPTDSTATSFTPPPGQSAQLTTDSTHCNYYWTHANGISYQFRTPVTDRTQACAVTPKFAGLAGRLITIYGRNQHATVGLGYTFDNGVASSSAGLNQIVVTADGVSVASTLTFADYGSSCSPAVTMRLLQSITRPYDSYQTYYNYDCAGNLTQVLKQPTSTFVCQNSTSNNACAVERYAYSSSNILTAAAGPIWSASLTDSTNLASGTNGAYIVFNYVSGSPSIANVQTVGVLNYTVNDGYSTSPFNPAGTSGVLTYGTASFDSSGQTTTFHDTDNHKVQYTYDDFDRVTNEQVSTGSTTLSSSVVWNANNQLSSETDVRGNVKNFAYDAAGDLIAEAWPTVSMMLSNGSTISARPTTLLTYDNNYNLVASCDAVWSQAHNANWDGSSTPVVCPTTVGSSSSPGAFVSQFSDSSGGYEPFGEIADTYSPLGYHRHYTYNGNNEGGTSGNASFDFGDPTTIAGDTITELLGVPSFQPTEQFVYDVNGNVVCHNGGQGWSILQYDGLSRITAYADEDDSSLTQSGCSKTAGISGSNLAILGTYTSDGQLDTLQLPSNRQAGKHAGLTYAYDLDGNEISETGPFGCTGLRCSDPTIQKFYDGLDRLIEVVQPMDSSDSVNTPWMTRYIYDISQGGNVTIGSQQNLNAYGNMYKTQEYVTVSNQANPYWTDLNGDSYDAADRQLQTFLVAAGTMATTSRTYDSSGNQGLLSSVSDATNENSSYTYDSRNRVSTLSYSGPVQTAPKTFLYDPVGHTASVSQPLYQTLSTGGNSYLAASAARTYGYDAEGRRISSSEPNYGSNFSTLNPTRFNYDYYPDGSRMDTSVTSTAITATNLLQYAYRNDGRLAAETANYKGAKSFAWTYTPGGRVLSQSDPFTGTTTSATAMAKTRTKKAAAIATPLPVRSISLKTNVFAPSLQKIAFGVPSVSTSTAGVSQVAAGAASAGSSTTYSATTFTYNYFGEATSVNYPMGRSYSSINYDDMGQLTTYTGYGTMNFVNSYNNREELTGQHAYDQGNTSNYDTNWPHFSQQGYLGLMTPVNEGSSIGVNTTSTFDVLDSQLESVQQNRTSDGSLVNKMSWSRDSDDRQAQGNYTTNSGGNTQNGQFNKFFDGEGHLVNFSIPKNSFWVDGNYGVQCNDGNPPLSKFQDPNPNEVGQVPYIWGSDGHPMVLFGDSVHWDGNSVLFTGDENGNLDDIKVGNLADILPDGTTVVRDRDWSGSIVMSHSAGGYSSWLPPNPNHNRCVPTNPPPAVPSTYVEPGTANSSTSVTGSGLVVTQPAIDSYFDGLNYIEGSRNYDSQSEGWSTPDSTRGDPEDPISQKSFTWNRNNPIGFGDFNGNESVAIPGTVYPPFVDDLPDFGGFAIRVLLLPEVRVSPYIAPFVVFVPGPAGDTLSDSQIAAYDLAQFKKGHPGKQKGQGRRRKFSRGLYESVVNGKGTKCTYCNNQTNRNSPYDPKDPLQYVIDHYISIKNGGDNSFENLVPSCFYCNSLKGSMNGDDFRKIISGWRV